MMRAFASDGCRQQPSLEASVKDQEGSMDLVRVQPGLRASDCPAAATAAKTAETTPATLLRESSMRPRTCPGPTFS
jgi:hypothetical protein